MHSKGILPLIFFALICSHVKSQNLILNGDFEDINICTEQIAKCAPEAWRLTSSKYIYFHKSKENNLVDFLVFSEKSPNKRTYIQSRLGDTLIPGETYRLSMDICPDGLAINRIGINFSDTLIHYSSDTLLTIAPDITFINNRKLLRKRRYKHWLHLEKEFVAKKQANYIQIGNFDKDENLISKKVRSITGVNTFRYKYFIDNIKLESINNIHPVSDIVCTKNIIYPQNDRHPVDRNLFKIYSTTSCSDVPHHKTLARVDTIMIFNDLMFEFDSYTPSTHSLANVDSIFNSIENSIDSIIIIGHTDNIGTMEYNDLLSLNRARSIANYITSLEIIPEGKVRFYGKGFRNPIAPNTTEAGRYKNRRVEIVIKYDIIEEQ